MDMETNLPEEETSILTLTDENGQDLDFEYLDCIAYQDKEYLVLMPEGEDEIVIMEIEPVDEENENYLAVEDEAVLDPFPGSPNRVLPSYVQRRYRPLVLGHSQAGLPSGGKDDPWLRSRQFLDRDSRIGFQSHGFVPV